MTTIARTAFLALALGALIVSPACKGEEASPEDAAAKQQSDLKEAEARLRNAKYADAEKIYLRILEHDPNQPDALAGMSQIRLTEQDSASAEVLLKRSLEARPEHAPTLFLLGELRRLDERHADSVEPYKKAFELEPNNADYGLAYGVALKKSGQFAEAEGVLRKVGEMDPNIHFVWSELGDALREQGKADEALKTYMKAQNTYRSDKMARAGAAMIYETRGDTKLALDEWSGYVQMDCCSQYSNDVAKKKIDELRAKIAAGTDEAEGSEAAAGEAQEDQAEAEPGEAG